MKYQEVVEGTFLERPNRFLALVKIGETIETVHVKSTGRLKELLIPGSRVFLSRTSNPDRKTAYDLISVYKEDALGIKGTPPLLFNIDSQAPNEIFEEYAKEGHFIPNLLEIKREVTYGDSRFDFLLKTKDKEIFAEIKGVTLEVNGVAMFPGSPTLRGIKHINGLIKAVKEGYDAYIVFIIKMSGIKAFSPHREMHPEFADALSLAKEEGVNILALGCEVTRDRLAISTEAKAIPIIL